MSERIDLRNCRDEYQVVKTACEMLRNGDLVVLPTETVYGIAADPSNPSAVEKLLRLKGRASDRPFSVAITGYQMLEELLPELSPLQYRLARRCWPGPVTLVLPAAARGSFVYELPEPVRKTIMPQQQVGFRVPSQETTLEVLKRFNAPLILTSANRSGEGEIVEMDDLVDTFGEEIALYLDDGPAKSAKPSTVLEVTENAIRILREGIVPRVSLERLTAKIIIFICTGNTCRSPMAEAICRQLLAQRIGCTEDELEDRGYVIMSAGVAVSGETPASSAAQQVMLLRNASLARHFSQPVSETLIRFADRIFAMTRSHRETILSHWPNADARLSVLRTDGGDISDPYGGELTLYENCANQIESELLNRIDELL